MRWLTPDWDRLRAGEKIEFTFPVHPQAFGFSRITLAEQVGQAEDWALSMSDGSRLHLWLMPAGRWIMHRDAVDPARGPIQAVVHAVTESNAGKFFLFAALVVGVGALARSARA